MGKKKDDNEYIYYLSDSEEFDYGESDQTGRDNDPLAYDLRMEFIRNKLTTPKTFFNRLRTLRFKNRSDFNLFLIFLALVANSN